MYSLCVLLVYTVCIHGPNTKDSAHKHHLRDPPRLDVANPPKRLSPLGPSDTLDLTLTHLLVQLSITWPSLVPSALSEGAPSRPH